MSDFVTISKSDEQFWPLLSGEFSKTHFAQPVQNLYVNSVDEMVTFKIIERKPFSLLQALSSWYSLARNIYLIFPVVTGLSFLFFKYSMVDGLLVLSSVIGLQFFLMALTLYNDYRDYIFGIDRVNENSSNKPLVMGLMRAFQARQLAFVFLVLSILSSAYCFWMKPLSLGFAALALLIAMTLTSSQILKKMKSLSLIATFLLAGPLLIAGFEYLLYDAVSMSSIYLGFIMGLHALKYDYSKQMRDIYFNSKALVNTLPTYFGFERSKWVYLIFSALHLVLLTLFALEMQMKEIYLLIIIALCFEVYINRWMLTAPSFLSSQITYSLSLQKLHYTMECGLLVFIFLSPLWLSWF